MSEQMPQTSKIMMVVVLAALAGCAQSKRETIFIRSGEPARLDHFDVHKQSLVVELKAGEVVPVDITVAGDLAETPPNTSIPLTVKRDCYLRIDDRGLRISKNGRDFPEKSRVPGSFQLGVGVTAAGKRATMRVVTPVW